MENIQAHYKEMRQELYDRYRLARTPEEKQKVIRDMQRFNMEIRQFRGADCAYHGQVIAADSNRRPETGESTYTLRKILRRGNQGNCLIGKNFNREDTISPTLITIPPTLVSEQW